MKKYRLYILSAAVLLSVAAIVGMLSAGRPAAAEPDHTEPRSTVTTATTAPSVRYTLGAWNGRLALYVPDNPYPQEVFDVFIRSFPPEERERLEQGIAVFSDAELKQLLEDYTS